MYKIWLVVLVILLFVLGCQSHQQPLFTSTKPALKQIDDNLNAIIEHTKETVVPKDEIKAHAEAGKIGVKSAEKTDADNQKQREKDQKELDNFRKSRYRDLIFWGLIGLGIGIACMFFFNKLLGGFVAVSSAVVLVGAHILQNQENLLLWIEGILIVLGISYLIWLAVKRWGIIKNIVNSVEVVKSESSNENVTKINGILKLNQTAETSAVVDEIKGK